MKKESFTLFMKQVAVDLQQSGNLGTAHVYRSTLNAILTFQGSDRLSFREITPEWMKHFEGSLRARGCSWNTVSTYLRTLRAVYNRAVDLRKASYVPHLFRSVYTGTRADRRRALDMEDMKKVFARLLQSDAITPAMKGAQELFILMFLLRGLPFVDLAYIQKKDLNGNILTYHRRKTGRQITITVTKDAMNIIREYMDTTTESPYLFPILSAEGGEDTIYREYQQALRIFNYQLTKLGELLGLTTELTSYTARHTWATLAYYLEVHPGIIREAMGHSSIKVTETYLKPFNIKKLDETNLSIIGYAKRSFEG